LSRFALELCAQLQKKFPLATYELNASSEDRAIERIQTGQAHLAFTAGEVPSGLYARTLAESFFYTYVGAGHALYSLAKKKKEVPIEEVLKFPFVSPHRSFLGAVGRKQSNDGWRDDKFPRLVRFKATSLKLVETLVVRGEALAYLPDYFAQTLAVEALKISGCPYSCSQKIKLVARNPEEVSWIRWIYGAAALAR
jgi:DNA-binding transcriptional LysR family regulator